MSKGSRPRPMQINRDKFNKNWDKIFKNKSKPPKKGVTKNEPTV